MRYNFFKIHNSLIINNLDIVFFFFKILWTKIISSHRFLFSLYFEKRDKSKKNLTAQPTTPQKIYFKGLNALRFAAAYLVVIHHAETIRQKYNLFHLQNWSFFQNGGLAVQFFFVLSGFLITYLLLGEIKRTQTININFFYMRRILRIWPLYFLIVFLGAFLVPTILESMNYPYEKKYTFGEALPFFLVFQSFMVNVLFGSHLLEPLWSIGVEEYFYLLVAPFVKWFRKNILPLLWGIIGLKILLEIFFYIGKNYFHFADNQVIAMTHEVIGMLAFEMMAIGGLGAWAVFFHRGQVEKNILFSKKAQILLFLLIVLRLVAHLFLLENVWLYKFFFLTPILKWVTEGVLFLWLILNIAVNPTTLFRLNHRWLQELGEISYGIYMYQMLVIFAAIFLLKKILLQTSPLIGSLIYYIFITLGVILVAYCSKRFFEDYFLKWKDKFTA